MKIAIGPLLSPRVSGWFGHSTYSNRGVVKNPYPIAIRAKQYPHRFIIHGYGAYYHPYGWIYERRRTWHGLQMVAKRAPVPNITRTPAQQANRQKYGEAVGKWRSMQQGVKDYYNISCKPRRMSGWNLFLKSYLTGKPV